MNKLQKIALNQITELVRGMDFRMTSYFSYSEPGFELTREELKAKDKESDDLWSANKNAQNKIIELIGALLEDK